MEEGGLLKKQGIKKILNKNSIKNNNWQKIWTLFNLELWLKIFMVSESAEITKDKLKKIITP